MHFYYYSSVTLLISALFHARATPLTSHYAMQLGFFCMPFCALASDPLCRDAAEESRALEQQQEDSEEGSDARHDLSKIQLAGDEDEGEDAASGISLEMKMGRRFKG